MIDPPRDYSVYDMSWAGPSASLIATMADLNRFYGADSASTVCCLPEVSSESRLLAQMQREFPASVRD
jgi:D-alanyl-D-alanine carboxypeptidase